MQQIDKTLYHRVNILQVGSEDIWIGSSKIPFDISEVWEESLLVRSRVVASYIPTKCRSNICRADIGN